MSSSTSARIAVRAARRRETRTGFVRSRGSREPKPASLSQPSLHHPKVGKGLELRRARDAGADAGLLERVVRRADRIGQTSGPVAVFKLLQRRTHAERLPDTTTTARARVTSLAPPRARSERDDADRRRNRGSGREKEQHTVRCEMREKKK